MAKLYFRYGAMGSSKSANAIMVQYNYQERGQKALLVKPGIDQRDGEKIVGSRCGLSAPCILMEELDRINYREYNCIVVDEAQFLTKAQVQRLVEIVDDDGIPWCAMACARISAVNCSRVANGCSPGRIPLRK